MNDPKRHKDFFIVFIPFILGYIFAKYILFEPLIGAWVFAWLVFNIVLACGLTTYIKWLTLFKDRDDNETIPAVIAWVLVVILFFIGVLGVDCLLEQAFDMYVKWLKS